MTRVVLIVLAAAPLLVLLGSANQGSKTDPVGYAPPQPIAYSHKTHLALGLKCSSCHGTKERGEDEGFTMGFPKDDFCMGCHSSIKKESPEIIKLAKAAADKKPVEWKDRMVQSLGARGPWRDGLYVRYEQSACSEHEGLHGLPRRTQRSQWLRHLPRQPMMGFA